MRKRLRYYVTAMKVLPNRAGLTQGPMNYVSACAQARWYSRHGFTCWIEEV